MQPWSLCGPSFQLRLSRIHQGQQEASLLFGVICLCQPAGTPRCLQLAVADGGRGPLGVSAQQPVLSGVRSEASPASEPALLSRPWRLRPRPCGAGAPSRAGLPPPQRTPCPGGGLGQEGIGGLPGAQSPGDQHSGCACAFENESRRNQNVSCGLTPETRCVGPDPIKRPSGSQREGGAISRKPWHCAL